MIEIRNLAACVLLASLLSVPACALSPEPTREARSSSATWGSRAPVPTARTEVTAAARGSEILVIGGFAEGRGTVKTVEIYDSASDSWRTGPRLPIALNHPMSATLDGVAYVLGGYRGPGLDNQTRRAFAWDGTWEEIAPMPAPRAAGGAVAARGRIYVVGGVGRSGLARATFVYNPRRDRWSRDPGIPTRRQHLGAAGYRGKVYVVAGRKGGFDSNLGVVERYNPATARWRRLPPLPTPRGGLAATATRDGLIVAAGGEGPDGTFDEVEAYNVATGRWRSLPPLPTARHGLGVVTVRGAVYALAGGPQPGLTYSDANERLAL